VPTERDELERVGATVWRSLLDESWCERLRHAIERCRNAPGPHYAVLSPPGLERVDSDLFRWSDDPDIGELVRDSPLVDAAATLLGTDEVVLIEDQWFASAPRSSTPSPWHQDQPYYRLDRAFLTVWITLDDVDVDCSLRVVEGSHATGLTYAPVEFSATTTTIDGDSALSPVPAIDDEPEHYSIASWSLRAGDAIALDSRTLHATGTGAPAAQFRRVSTRWTTPDTRYRAVVPGAASFWDTIPHGLEDGDLLACDAFPLVARR
jgi:ectoine hydroxylase-related dioxygenase (phytanoyl-CoA dioxygenase family)